jgi:hypothetical protein
MKALTLMRDVQPSHDDFDRCIKHDGRSFRVDEHIELSQGSTITRSARASTHDDDLLDMRRRDELRMQFNEKRNVRAGSCDAEVDTW